MFTDCGPEGPFKCHSHGRAKIPRAIDPDGRIADLPLSCKIVLRALLSDPPATQPTLDRRTWLSRRTLRYAISRLEEEDLIDSSPIVGDARRQEFAPTTEARRAAEDVPVSPD